MMRAALSRVAPSRFTTMPNPQVLNAIRRRRRVSALWWMVVPAAVLLPFRGTSLAPAICGTTPNLSYDGMLIAAGFGVGLAQWVMSRPSGSNLHHRAGDALDVFEVLIMAALAGLYGAAGIHGSALVWGIGLLVTLAGLMQQIQAERRLAPAARSADAPPTEAPRSDAPPTDTPRTAADWVASGLLLTLGTVFILFPVTKPWTGPVEPFVRWHPFSPEIETVWRGIFASFAVAMIVAAWDPGRRHRPFLLALGLSGTCHGLFMGADNLIAAWAGTANGNLEHLYGDVAGWLAIGLISLAYWRWRRP